MFINDLTVNSGRSINSKLLYIILHSSPFVWTSSNQMVYIMNQTYCVLFVLFTGIKSMNAVEKIMRMHWIARGTANELFLSISSIFQILLHRKTWPTKTSKLGALQKSIAHWNPLDWREALTVRIYHLMWNSFITKAFNMREFQFNWRIPQSTYVPVPQCSADADTRYA